MKKYDNYIANLAILKKANEQDLSNEFVVSGIVDMFFLQFELGWKVFKELMMYEGRQEAKTGSPRTIIKTAYAVYDFVDEDIWLQMLDDRNDLSHQYDSEKAYDLAEKAISKYIPEFEKIGDMLGEKYGEILSDSEVEEGQ